MNQTYEIATPDVLLAHAADAVVASEELTEIVKQTAILALMERTGKALTRDQILALFNDAVQAARERRANKRH